MLSPRSRDARLLLLAAAAGAADAIGYLSFGHIFIANMTGNIVLLGLVIGQAEWSSTPRYGMALLGFILGAAIGAGIVGNAQDRDEWPSQVTVALIAEGAVLLALAVASAFMTVAAGAVVYAFIAIGALAMGIQTTAVRRLQVAGLSTTVITSTIASVVETVMARLRAVSFTAAASSRSSALQASAAGPQPSHLGVQVAVILGYGLAAACVALLESRLLPRALWLPAGLVLLVILVGRSTTRAPQHAKPTVTR